MLLCLLPALLAWDLRPGAPAALSAADSRRGGLTAILGRGPEPRIGIENVIDIIVNLADTTVDTTVRSSERRAAAAEEPAHFRHLAAASSPAQPAAAAHSPPVMALPSLNDGVPYKSMQNNIKNNKVRLGQN